MKTLLLIPFLFVCSMVIGQSSKIIGKPIKIGKLEVAQYDFPVKMSWSAANDSCASLGSGWRLPTTDELNLLFLNKKKIGGFNVEGFYWIGALNQFEINQPEARVQYFTGGGHVVTEKFRKWSVRAVRSF